MTRCGAGTIAWSGESVSNLAGNTISGSQTVTAVSMQWRLRGCFEHTFAAGLTVTQSGDVIAMGSNVVAGRGDVGSVMAVTSAGEVRWHTTLSYPAISAAVEVRRRGSSSLLIVASYFGALTALDSEVGSIVWELREPLNMYTPGLVDDLDDDGVDDLVVANGGDQMKAMDEARPTGSLLVVSGSSGKVIGRAQLPDGGETYAAPLIVRSVNSAPRVVFGTGGDTHRGSLFATPIESILKGDLSKSVRLASSSGSFGWIATPAVAGVESNPIVVGIDLGGTVVAAEIGGRRVWSQQLGASELDQPPAVDRSVGHLPRPELSPPNSTSGGDDSFPISYVSPTVADFDCDGESEVLASRLMGSLGNIRSRSYALLSLVDGRVETEWETPGGGYAVPLVADFTRDGCADALISVGESTEFTVWDVKGSTLGGSLWESSHGVTPAMAAVSDGVSLTALGCGIAGHPEDLGVELCRFGTSIRSMADVVRSGFVSER